MGKFQLKVMDNTHNNHKHIHLANTNSTNSQCSQCKCSNRLLFKDNHNMITTLSLSAKAKDTLLKCNAQTVNKQ